MERLHSMGGKVVLRKAVRFILIMLLFALCMFASFKNEEKVRKDAIKRCGSETNIYKKYTQSGDTYYGCINKD